LSLTSLGNLEGSGNEGRGAGKKNRKIGWGSIAGQVSQKMKVDDKLTPMRYRRGMRKRGDPPIQGGTGRANSGTITLSKCRGVGVNSSRKGGKIGTGQRGEQTTRRAVGKKNEMRCRTVNLEFRLSLVIRRQRKIRNRGGKCRPGQRYEQKKRGVLRRGKV